MKVYGAVKQFVSLSLPEDVDDSEDFFAAGLVDSLFAIQLVAFVEKEFGVAVEREDLDIANFLSINAIVAFVSRKTGVREPAHDH